MTTKRKPKQKPEAKKVFGEEKEMVPDLLPIAKIYSAEGITKPTPDKLAKFGDLPLREISATKEYIENEIKEMADRDIDTSGPTEISFTGDISGADHSCLEIEKLEPKVIIDDRDQLLRAVLNKAFPFGKFVFIDTNLLADECRKIGLEPGKDFARGVTIK